MCIVKGVLVGILFFIIGWSTYIGIRLAIAASWGPHVSLTSFATSSPKANAAVQTAKAGVQGQAYGGDFPWFLLPHGPVLWITLLTAIAIGLWIMRTRTQTA